MASPNSKRVFIAGHGGMVGSAIARQIEKLPNIDVVVADRSDLDLKDASKLFQFLKDQLVNQVYLSAAKVGGIHANDTFPAEFIYENLAIETNVIHQAYLAGINKLLFLGSSCIYPKFSSQPMTESALLTGELESTNEPYAIAKIAGIKMCESYNRQYGTDYRSVMPTNLYGPNDNFHPQNSHVIPSLMLRIHEAMVQNASEVTIWGTGEPCREFLHVDDVADACIFIMNLDSDLMNRAIKPNLSHLNVGAGKDVSIRKLAETLVKVVGFNGKLKFDTTKPDGTPKKLLDVTKMTKLGWRYQIELELGLETTYTWFKNNQDSIRQ